MNRLQDKRVKKFLVLDVETIGVDDRGIFDIGYIICDKLGNKFIKRSYLVKEVFLDMSRMRKAFYFKKYPQYLQGLNDNEFQIETWENIMREMYSLIKEYDIKVISAYNLQFDLGALQYTNKELRGKDFEMFKHIEKLCIWGMSAETICQQKTFRKQIQKREILTASKKFLSTSAETVYKYITQNWEFEESHTGLADVEIEVEILAKCIAQHKKCSKGIVGSPYRLAKVGD